MEKVRTFAFFIVLILIFNFAHAAPKLNKIINEGKQEGKVLECMTSKGQVGRCATFKDCYPYFKIPDISALDGWVMGVYDTCTIPQNPNVTNSKVTFGICCSDLATQSSKQYPVIEPPDDFSERYTQKPVSTTRRTVHTTWPTKRPTTAFTRPILLVTSTDVSVRPSPSTSCGAKNGHQDLDEQKIVGGSNAQIGEWPWIAALFNAGRHVCGGSLIDDKHILTAAHCVAHMNPWDVARLTVRLGEYDLRTSLETHHIEKRVRRVVRHRGFDSRTLYNDVAILTLNEPIRFSEHIRPICLPSGSQLYAGKNATVIGWGSLRENGPAPSILQQVTVPVWSNTVCKQKYGLAAPGGIVDSFLCAGQAAKDSCSGDSGGPLMVNDGRWTQIGIVSWGIGCGKGQFPGVYTRVTHFLPWIFKNLK